MKTVLVANPTAQSGRAEKTIATAQAYLHEYGVEHEFVATLPHGGTVGEVRAAVESGARLVIAMGGDGTFAEAAKGILASSFATQTELAILPTGTANDQAKSLGLGTGDDSLRDNITIAISGHTLLLDVGRVERLDEAGHTTHSDLFFDSMSVGFGAGILTQRNRDREIAAQIPLVRRFYRDNWVYAGAIVKRLLRSVSGAYTFDAEIVADGTTHPVSSLIDVIFKNTQVYGGQWILSETARADDGYFEAVCVQGVSDFASRMLSAHTTIPIGPYELSQIGLTSLPAILGTKFEITILAPGKQQPAVQIDGEEFPAGDHFRIKVLPRILSVRIPRVVEHVT